MSHRSTLFAVGLVALCLSGCARQEPPAPLPDMPAGATAMPDRDPSVPDATAVFAPTAAASVAGATAGRANQTMTRKEESNAMPMVGQNNDHSAPVAPAKPAKPASAP